MTENLLKKTSMASGLIFKDVNNTVRYMKNGKALTYNSTPTSLHTKNEDGPTELWDFLGI